MRRMSPARIEAHNRRKVAIHEAGHAVVARHVRVTAFNPEIWRNPDAGKNENTWLGNIRVERSPRISRAHMAMVAVAGAIAEHVWRDDADFLENEGEWAWDEEAIMSPTDWDMAGCDPGEPNAAFMRAVGRAPRPAGAVSCGLSYMRPLVASSSRAENSRPPEPIEGPALKASHQPRTFPEYSGGGPTTCQSFGNTTSCY